MRGQRSMLRLLVEELAPFILLALVIAFFSLPFVVGEKFVSPYNLRMVSVQSVVVLLAAMGMTAVIVSGGIDLSVGSTLALTTVVIAVVTKALMGHGWPPGLAAAAAIAAGIGAATFCGVLNGLSITVLRVNPFVTTLGTLFMFRGLALFVAGSRTVETGRDDLRFLMDIEPRSGWMLVSPGVWIALTALVATIVLLKLTVFGRYTYAVGSSEATGRLCGVRVGIQKLLIYTFAGLMAGIAGVMLFSFQNQGDPTAAVGKELYVIAAVVIGGASLAGGRGSAIGTAVGALFVQFLEQGLVLTGVPDPVQKIIVGGFLIFAVALDQYRARKWGAT